MMNDIIGYFHECLVFIKKGKKKKWKRNHVGWIMYSPHIESNEDKNTRHFFSIDI